MASKLEELRAAAKAKAELAYKAEGIERNGTTTQQQQVQTESTAGLPASSSICSSGGSSGSGRAVSTVRPITGSTGNSVDSSLVVHNVSNVQTEVELSPQQFTVVEKIAQVEQLLLRNDPLMPVLLKQIHAALLKDPELVHLLQPEQIGTVVKGLMEVTKVVIVATAVKRATTANGKKLSQLTLADL